MPTWPQAIIWTNVDLGYRRIHVSLVLDELKQISGFDWHYHYTDGIMGAMASQITSLTSVNSIVYTGADQRKTSKLLVTGHCAGNSPVTGKFPAQMASNAENISIWWRQYAVRAWPLSNIANRLVTMHCYSLVFVWGIHRASYAEKVYIWWRHHDHM